MEPDDRQPQHPYRDSAAPPTIEKALPWRCKWLGHLWQSRHVYASTKEVRVVVEDYVFVYPGWMFIVNQIKHCARCGEEF